MDALGLLVSRDLSVFSSESPQSPHIYGWTGEEADSALLLLLSFVPPQTGVTGSCQKSSLLGQETTQVLVDVTFPNWDRRRLINVQATTALPDTHMPS